MNLHSVLSLRELPNFARFPSAKGIYRRYLKKLAQGTDEELENPEFGPVLGSVLL